MAPLVPAGVGIFPVDDKDEVLAAAGTAEPKFSVGSDDDELVLETGFLKKHGGIHTGSGGQVELSITGRAFAWLCTVEIV